MKRKFLFAHGDRHGMRIPLVYSCDTEMVNPETSPTGSIDRKGKGDGQISFVQPLALPTQDDKIK